MSSLNSSRLKNVCSASPIFFWYFFDCLLSEICRSVPFLMRLDLLLSSHIGRHMRPEGHSGSCSGSWCGCAWSNRLGTGCFRDLSARALHCRYCWAYCGQAIGDQGGPQLGMSMRTADCKLFEDCFAEAWHVVKVLFICNKLFGHKKKFIACLMCQKWRCPRIWSIVCGFQKWLESLLGASMLALLFSPTSVANWTVLSS